MSKENGNNVETLATLEKNALETIKVSISRYEGHEFLDMRVWRDNKDGKGSIPTKKGLSLNFETFKELMPVLSKAQKIIAKRESSEDA